MKLRRLMSAVLVAALVSFAGVSCGDNLPTATPSADPSCELINLFDGYGRRKAEPAYRVRVWQRNPRSTVARSSGPGIGR